jgi:hypothetical protein
MSEYVYAIIISSSNLEDPANITTKIHLDNKTTTHINTTIKQNFNNSRYNGYLDEVMLFNVCYCNQSITMRYNILIVRTLAQIDDNLFIPLNETGEFLGNNINFDYVYDYYPSYRFSKFDSCDYVQLRNDTLQFDVKVDNSHQLNISQIVF